jgi:TolB-like protein
VLPFANFSDDREQQYFADGITVDLTTDLSRLADMVVISRNTAFTYRDKPVGTRQIGRELCVRYVLEGSVRRWGNQIRVTLQLIDAETDAHLWAERFDWGTGDLFALQNEITSRIAVALDLELIGAEAARQTEHPDALDYILRGRAAMLAGPPAREDYGEAISLFERALALSPCSAEVQSWLATALTARVLDRMADSSAADIVYAGALVRNALAASPRSPLAHFANGQVLRAQGRPAEAISEYETVLAFNRNWVFAITNLGWCKFLTGSIEEAIRLHEQAIRLSPRDPRIGDWYYLLGRMHLLQSRTDQATLWLGKARGVISGTSGPSRPSRRRLCPQRRFASRHRRTRRSSQAKQRRSFFEHRPLRGRYGFRGCGCPCPIRDHLSGWPAQSRNAGGMKGIFVPTTRRGIQAAATPTPTSDRIGQWSPQSTPRRCSGPPAAMRKPAAAWRRALQCWRRQRQCS